ncbi:MAG: peptidase M14, partial [Longimicrobiales bacterium]
ADIRAGALANYDVLIFQDQSAQSILTGFSAEQVPAPYSGGLEGVGSDEVRAFVRNGGRVVAVEAATEYVSELFGLGVRDATARLSPNEFYIPGSLLRLELGRDVDLTQGMRPEVAAWFWESSRAFQVTDPRVRVVATYGTGDPLLSGWAIGGSHVAGQPAILEADLGPGSVVLFGFQPNYRAQSMATWPLLFNALRK